MYSLKRQKGNIAEEIVVSRVKREGFNIICQNYLKKWGEIDIVAEKSRKIHFIEVKSVSRETKSYLAKESCFMENVEGKVWKICDFMETDTVSRETDKNSFNPVWNMTNKKKLRFSKVIRTYLADTYREVFPDFQVDLYAVSLDFSRKVAYISKVENILLKEM